MQIYVIAALVIGWAASVGVTGWKAFDFGQQQCQLSVIKASNEFLKRRGKYLARENRRNLTRAEGRSWRSEQRNDRYEAALDVIRAYGVRLDCEVPAAVREAVSNINASSARRGQLKGKGE